MNIDSPKKASPIASLSLLFHDTVYCQVDGGLPTYVEEHLEDVFEQHEGEPTEVVDSMLCPGAVVSGARVRRSILSNRARVEEGASVEESMLMSGVSVGRGARIRRTIDWLASAAQRWRR